MRTVTHLQITVEQRVARGNGYLNDRAHSTRKHASYLVINQSKGNEGRAQRFSSTNPQTTSFKSFGPGWLMPRVLQTVTAAIVWGTCGKMADVQEY